MWNFFKFLTYSGYFFCCEILFEILRILWWHTLVRFAYNRLWWDIVLVVYLCYPTIVTMAPITRPTGTTPIGPSFSIDVPADWYAITTAVSLFRLLALVSYLNSRHSRYLASHIYKAWRLPMTSLPTIHVSLGPCQAPLTSRWKSRSINPPHFRWWLKRTSINFVSPSTIPPHPCKMQNNWSITTPCATRSTSWRFIPSYVQFAIIPIFFRRQSGLDLSMAQILWRFLCVKLSSTYHALTMPQVFVEDTASQQAGSGQYDDAWVHLHLPLNIYLYYHSVITVHFVRNDETVKA